MHCYNFDGVVAKPRVFVIFKEDDDDEEEEDEDHDDSGEIAPEPASLETPVRLQTTESTPGK